MRGEPWPPGQPYGPYLTFRSAYDEARKLKHAQDEYCRLAESGEWAALGSKPFPDDLRWETLVDVLRGRVKVSSGPHRGVTLCVLTGM